MSLFRLTAILSDGAAMNDIIFFRLFQLGRLENEELDEGVDEEKSGEGNPPISDMSRQWNSNGVPSEFDTDQNFGDDNGKKHPGLTPNLVTFRVIQELKGFTKTNGSPEQKETQAYSVKPVIGRNPENEF